MKILKFTAVLTSLLWSVGAIASGGIVGEISSINIKETGYIFVQLKAAHNNPDNCQNNNNVVFTHSHIAKKELLTVALAAKTSGKESGFWLSGCYEAYGSSYAIAITTQIK